IAWIAHPVMPHWYSSYCLVSCCIVAILFNIGQSSQLLNNTSEAALSALLAMQLEQRTVKNALQQCSTAQAAQLPKLNCAWLVLTGSYKPLNSSIRFISPVEYLTCFDPTRQFCEYHQPVSRYTARMDCLGCPACQFKGCNSDLAGCQLACVCDCGSGDLGVIACHQLCDGAAQCHNSLADEALDNCKLVVRQPTTPAAPTGLSGAAAGLTAAALTLLAAAAAVGLFLFYRRRQAAAGAGGRGAAVEWRRLSTGGVGDGGEASIPLGVSA
ncbi:hypothetical protein BOX15_Mlig031973g1, partial [Macrostomum lignano]